MPRLLFEKKGSAIWISHLDLMRLFQRAFNRAGLQLTHTQGFNPRPSVSIALPLSVGVESRCELLDFHLEGAPVPNEQILTRLNEALVEGVRVRSVYDDGQKIKNLAYLDCKLTLEYDRGVPQGAENAIASLFGRSQLVVEKKSKNGTAEQNIIPMLRFLHVSQPDDNTLTLQARVCCQNPSLNPMLLSAAVEKELPDVAPNFVRCSREEIYDLQENIFR